MGELDPAEKLRREKQRALQVINVSIWNLSTVEKELQFSNLAIAC